MSSERRSWARSGRELVRATQGDVRVDVDVENVVDRGAVVDVVVRARVGRRPQEAGLW